MRPLALACTCALGMVLATPALAHPDVPTPPKAKSGTMPPILWPYGIPNPDSHLVITYDPLTNTLTIDPQDFTIARNGGDITGAQLSTNLGSGNVTILSSDGATSGSGNIYVDDDVSWNAHTLTLTAANDIDINRTLGGTGTSALTLNSGGTIRVNADITTGGQQTYNGAVLLGGSSNHVSLTTTSGGNISLSGTVDNATSEASQALAIDAGTGAVTFGGVVGGGPNGALDSLDVTAGTIVMSGGSLATINGQTYNGAVVINNPATLTGHGVTFNGTVDGAGGAPGDLTIHPGNGAVRFDDAVGSHIKLGALTVDGTGAVSVNGMFHVDTVDVAGDFSITSIGDAITQSGAWHVGGGSHFDAGAHAITLDDAGNEFTGAVSLTNSGANDVTLGSGSHALILGAVNVGGGTFSVDGVTPVTLTRDVTTTGGRVNLDGTVVLGAPTITIDTTGGGSSGANVSFHAALGNTTSTAAELSVNAGTGAVSFGGVVGGGPNGALDSLDVTAGTIVMSGGSLATINGQTYNGAVVINNPATLTGHGVTFNGTVDGAGGAPGDLTIRVGSGAVRFDDAVGSNIKLGALTIDGTGATDFGSSVRALSLATGTGSVTLNGNVTTGAGQAYHGAVYLGDDVALTTADGDVIFDATVDNATGGTVQALTISAGTGNVTFGGRVGGGTNGALAALQVMGTGTTRLMGNVTTAGVQSYGGAVALGTDVTLTTADSAVTFDGTVANATSGTPQGLTIDAGNGVVTFNDVVGSSTDPLGTLAIDGTGLVMFEGAVDANSLTSSPTTRLHGNVTTHGAQVYEGELDVFAPSLILDSNGGDITFHDISNQSTATTLHVDAGSGTVTFDGNVCGTGTGCTHPLSLDITATGGITQGTASVIDGSGTFTFDSGAADITLDEDNTFTGSVNLSGNNATINNAGALELGAVDVATLQVTADGAIIHNSATTLHVSAASSFDAGTNAITLGNGSNMNLGGPVYLSNSGANNATLDNGSHALILNNVTVGSGSLSLTGNGITQTTGSTITQAAGATAAVFDAGNSHALVLDNANNDITGPVTASGAGISITTKGTLTVASITNQSNHDLSLVAGGALVCACFSGAIDTGNSDITLTAKNGVLNFDSISLIGNNIALTGGNGLILGNVNANGTLTLTSTNTSIAQSSGTISATGVTTVNAGTGDVQLTGLINHFDNTVNLAGGTTAITNGSALTLGSVQTAALSVVSHGALNLGNGQVGGTLQATSNDGDIGEAAGGLTVTGAAVLDAGTGKITLTDTNNDFQGLVTATGTGISIADANDLQIASLSDNNNGDVVLVAGGVLSGVGALDAGNGDITLASNGGALTTATLIGNNLSLTGAGGLTLSGSTTANGTLQLNSNAGNIAQSAGVLTAARLTGSTAGQVTLTNVNAIGALGNFAANGFGLANGQTLTVDGSVDGGTGTVALTTTAGALNITGSVHGTTVVLSAAGNTLLTGTLGSSNGTTLVAGALQIGNGGTSGSISGDVVDNTALIFDRSDAVTYAGALSGGGTLTQAGTNELIVDGDSSAFTGTTTVQSGSLIVGSTAGNGAILGGDVSVDADATLGGHGRIDGNVTLGTGARVTPGNSIGTLTVTGNFTAAQGSVLDYEFGGPAASPATFTSFGRGDSIHVGGDLTLNGVTLEVADAGSMGAGLYNIFTYGGTLTESNGGLTLHDTTGRKLALQTLSAQRQINLIDTTGLTLNVWNANDKASATRMGGGDGTWSTNSSEWTDATGGPPNGAMHPIPGFALFGGDAGTVTVDDSAGSVSAQGMQFAVDGYRLTGDTLILTGTTTPVIRVGDGTDAGASMTATIASVLAGSNGLTKADYGTLILTGANTYSGGTTIAAGTLQIGNGGSIGSIAGDVTDNGILRFNRGNAIAFDGTISGSGGVIQSGTGTLSLSGPNTFTGGLRLDAGTVSVASDANLGDASGTLTFDGGTLQNTTAFTTARNMTLAGDGTLQTDADLTETGTIGGRGSLTKSGAMTLILTGANTYSGGTTIAAGTLQIGNGGSTGSIAGDVTDNGILHFSRGNAIAFDGTISGSGSVIQSGTGTLSLSGANTFTGGLRLDAGTVSVASDANLGDASGTLTFDGGTLQNTTAFTTARNMTLAGDGTFRTDADLVSSGVIGGTGSLTKAGSASLILTGTNTYSGGTTITAGTLQIGNGGSTGSIDGNVSDDGSLAFNRADDITFDGVISGTGAVTQAGNGTLSLTGANTYSGGTTIASGTLQIGNGGSTGSMIGDITDNASLVFNRIDDVVFDGMISGSGRVTQTGGGTLTLAGTNSYAGGTTFRAGTLAVANDHALGTGTLTMQSGTTLAFAADRLRLVNAVTLSGDPAFNVASGQTATLVGSVTDGTQAGTLEKMGAGTLVLASAETYSGGTTVTAGTLQVGAGGTTGSIAGNIDNAGTVAFKRSDTVTFAGVIAGTGSVVQAGTGTLTLTGANTYTGGTVVAAGTLVGTTASLHGAIADHAALVFVQEADGAFDGTLSGNGTLTKSGTGALTINGINTFAGSTTVTAGTLIVGDDAHAQASVGGTVHVAAGATLSGIGTIGGLELDGTLAAGNSIGTLHVTGDATFAPGSTWRIEAAADGQADRLDVAGHASLAGSALVLAQTGTWAPRTSYTILDAKGGVSGQFDSVSVNLAFLTPTLTYGAQAVSLSLQRNDTAFADVAQTSNQSNVGRAVQGLGWRNAIFDSIVKLDAPQARAAFDQLSGEWYASNRTARLEGSRYVRDAINQRLIEAATDGSAQSSRLGHSAGTFWVHGWGHWARRDGDGNAASMQAHGTGLLVGIDARVGASSHIGATLGTSQQSVRVKTRDSSGHPKATWLGIYGSSVTGPLRWRAGVAYAWQRLGSNRRIDVADLTGTVGRETHGSSRQAWLEATWPHATAHGHVAPFANLARVNVTTDAWHEQGTSAATLQGFSASDHATLGTLGVRAAWRLGNTGTPLRLHASAGVRHAFSGDRPTARLRLNGSAPFTVYGLPLAQNVLALQAGMNITFSPHVHLDIGYSGQFGRHTRDQGERMTLRVDF